MWICRWTFWLAEFFSPIYTDLPPWKSSQLLVAGQQYWQALGRHFRFHWPLSRWARGTKDEVKCPWRLYLVWLFSGYLIAKMAIVSYLYTNFKYRLDVWHLRVNKRIPLDENRCFSLDDLDGWSRKELIQLNEMMSWLRSIGVQVFIINDLLPIPIYYVIMLIMLNWCCLMPAFKRQELSFNSASFYFEPALERNRVHERMLDQVHEIKNQPVLYAPLNGPPSKDNLDELYNRYHQATESMDLDETNKLRQIFRLNKPQFRVTVWLIWALCSDKKNSNISEIEKTNRLISRQQEIPRLRNVTRTEHLSDRKHKRFVHCVRIVMCCFFLSCLVIFFSSGSYLFNVEMDRHLDYGRQSLACRKSFSIDQGVNQTLQKFWFDFPLTEVDSLRRVRVAFETGNDVSKLDMLLNRSNLQVFPPLNIMFGSELVINGIMICLWCGLYYCAIFMTFMYQLHWISEIHKQLDSPFQLLNKLTQINVTSSDLYGNASRKPLEEAQFRAKICRDLEDVLTRVYVNFRLYKTELVQHQAILEFIIRQLFLVVIIGTPLFLLSMSDSRRNNKVSIWIISLIAIGILNIVIVICVTLTSRINFLFARLNNIIAKCIENQIEQLHIVRLWRKKILSPPEVDALFGLSVFGIDLSHDNLIQFNSSVLGAFFYLYGIM